MPVVINRPRRADPPGCAPARIALHADAIPRQCEVAMLAAHLGLVVLGAAFSLGRGSGIGAGSSKIALRNFSSAKTGARAPRSSTRLLDRCGRGGRSGRRKVIAVKLP
jgi:hypothetical protein